MFTVRTISGASLLFFCLTMVGPFVPLHAMEIKPNAPAQYVVKTGDTLWNIASVYLEEAWQWPQIWALNTNIANPHLIYPGDEISLVMIDGQPRLRLQRGDRVDPSVVKRSPSVRRINEAAAIPALSLDQIEAWLAKVKMVDAVEFERLPYILAGIDGKTLLKTGDQVYVKGALAAGVSSFKIYQSGQQYLDPMTGALIGLEAQEVGQARLLSEQAGLATLKIVKVTEEVTPGDRLMVAEGLDIDATLFPQPPKSAVAGQIIGLRSDGTVAAAHSVVTIDLGLTDGLAVGDLLSVASPGESVKDPVTGKAVTLPDQTIGQLLVYQTLNQIAYALVLKTTAAVKIGFLAQSP
jgi:hypothetical protein